MARYFKSILVLGFLFVFSASIVYAETTPSAPLSYAVFAPTQNQEAVDAYKKLLIAGDKESSVTLVPSLQEGIDSKADVLVIHLAKADLTPVGEYDPVQLKKRKTIGIGYGAAKIFENCGLKISAGHCAHGVIGTPVIRVTSETTIDKTKWTEPVTLFEPPSLDKTNAHNDFVFGIYVGDKKPKNREGIEIIALFNQDANYAPVTRQKDAILIGINAPIENWSESFRTFIHGLGPALQQKPAKKSTQRAAGPDDVILGLWANVEGDAGTTRRMAVDNEGDKWRLDAWGAVGGKTELVWNDVQLERITENIGVSDRPCFFGIHDIGFATEYLTLRVEGDTPILEMITIFKDGSGRKHYRTVNKFKKETRSDTPKVEP